jgi:hypothetical protein
VAAVRVLAGADDRRRTRQPVLVEHWAATAGRNARRAERRARDDRRPTSSRSRALRATHLFTAS